MRLLALLILWPSLLFAQSAPAVQEGFEYQKQIQLDKAWLIVDSAPQVPVGVVDLDFDVTHPLLKHVFDLKLGHDYSNTNWSLVASPDVPHGSLVAGILADQMKSGAWIIPFNLASPNIPVQAVARAIQAAVDSGAKVINVSMSGPAKELSEIEVYRSVARYALEKDVLLIVSAANYGEHLDVHPLYPALLSKEFSNVITVGASGRQDQPMSFSNYSKTYVSLFAPGDDIKAITPKGYIYSDGTSEAAPITSGVAALVRQLRPDLTASQVKTIPMKTVDKNSTLKAKSVSGGRLNAYKAVRLAQAQRIRKPTQFSH